jgi:hypothetical protein
VPTIPDLFAEVSVPLKHDTLSRTAFVTFGVDNQGAFTDPTTMAEAIWDPWNDNFGSRIDTECLQGPIHVQMGTGAGILSGDGTSSAMGTSTLESLPPNCAILCRKVSGVGGRGNRGRFYVPFACDESGVSQNGQIDGAVVTATQAACDGLLADLDTAGVPMCILHTGAGVPARVISMNVDSLIATQRRRLGR